MRKKSPFILPSFDSSRFSPSYSLLLGMSFSDIEGTKTGVYVGIMNDDYKVVTVNSRALANGYCNTGVFLKFFLNKIYFYFFIYNYFFNIVRTTRKKLKQNMVVMKSHVKR